MNCPEDTKNVLMFHEGYRYIYMAKTYIYIGENGGSEASVSVTASTASAIFPGASAASDNNNMNRL